MRLAVWADLGRAGRDDLGPGSFPGPVPDPGQDWWGGPGTGQRGRAEARGRHCGSAKLSVELLLLVRLLVRDAGLLGLLQRVAALVLLLHAVDEQRDQEGGEEGAHHPAHNHSCGKRGQRSQPKGRR